MKQLLSGIWLSIGLPLWAAAQLLPSGTTTAGEQNLPAPTQWSVVERGPHSKTLEKTVYELGPGGRAVPRVHRIVELASGMHFVGSDGQLHESDASFDLTDDGHAKASRCPNRVIVAPSLADTNGVIDLLTADGQRMRSSIIGLVLFDPVSGKSLQVASARDVAGVQKALTPPDKLAEITARNIQRYGDPLGPTIDWLRRQGKSWEQIIESATRSGGNDLGF
jgi:hypothetical protein